MPWVSPREDRISYLLGNTQFPFYVLAYRPHVSMPEGGGQRGREIPAARPHLTGDRPCSTPGAVSRSQPAPAGDGKKPTRISQTLLSATRRWLASPPGGRH